MRKFRKICKIFPELDRLRRELDFIATKLWEFDLFYGRTILWNNKPIGSILSVEEMVEYEILVEAFESKCRDLKAACERRGRPHPPLTYGTWIGFFSKNHLPRSF